MMEKDTIAYDGRHVRYLEGESQVYISKQWGHWQRIQRDVLQTVIQL